MFFKSVIALIGAFFTGVAIQAQGIMPIGDWHEHLPYYQAMGLTKGPGKIFCYTPLSFFSVDTKDNSITRFSKTSGLSEVGISAIEYDTKTGKLLVAYSNSNIDIIYQNNIRNINDIKRKEVNADKNIYNIYPFQSGFYLSTGLGVIVIDEDKFEVKDTYVIGSNGNFTLVNGFCADANFFYAATTEGLKKAAISNLNLSDYRNWQLPIGIGLPPGEVQNVVNLQNKIIAQVNDSLWVLNGNNWTIFYADDWKITGIKISDDKLLACQQKNGAGRVIVLNTNGNVEKNIQSANSIPAPRQAIILDNENWIADTINGLTRFNNSFQNFVPNSPYGIATGEMTIQNNVLWIASGTVTEQWSSTNTKKGMYRLQQNEWLNYTNKNTAALDSLPDIITVTVDLRDERLWAGSFGGGLLNLKKDNIVQIYKQNSPLEASIFAPGSYRVSGLAFDNENNLWISNYGAAQDIVVKKSDGNWRKFFIPYTHSENAVSQLLIDDVNQKWIVSPKGNGLFCFNHGASIDNSGDDKWRYFRQGTGNGNLPDNNVLSIAKDKSGFIWVGTHKGIGIIQCPQDATSQQSCEAILPIVQQDNFAGYLFQNEMVQTIAVDGADRKWVGTKNGVWLISADGQKIIYRFAEDNSPLLNNDVKKITINQQSGEIFFATSKGICSFMGTATEGTSSNSNLLVFPNPVPPGYAGTIAIRGLVNNAIVKITEMDGRLVYQTRALGGQAVWDGKDYKGRRISTGVYLILISDDNRQEKAVGKIVFVK